MPAPTAALSRLRGSTWMPGVRRHRPRMTGCGAALTILRQPAVAEHIDHALLDRAGRRPPAASRCRAPPSAPAWCRHGRPRRCRRQASRTSRASARLHRWRSSRPPARRRPICPSRRAAKVAASCCCHLGQRQAFPLAIADLAQAVVDGVIVRRQLQRAAHQLHGHPGAAERACDERQRGRLRGRRARADRRGCRRRRPPACGRDR